MSNILIIKHGSLGDIAQASGAIQDISENHYSDDVHLLPYELIYSTMIVASMIGNYLYGIYSSQMGPEMLFQISLFELNNDSISFKEFFNSIN